MKFDKEHWKELDINVDSLWIIGPRAKGGKRQNVYHGNFTPQIPNQMIRRYTEKGGVVMDLFMGSGTTLFECETLERNFIGFDINKEIVDYVKSNMDDESPIKYFIHNNDVTDKITIQDLIEEDLKSIGRKSIDLLMLHPPYLNIIKFTDHPNDLSNINDFETFNKMFIQCIGNIWKYIKSNKYICLVMGDIYRESEVIPLGFYLMNAIKQNFTCKLKGIVIKDMVGNRGKLGIESLWRYRALKSDNFLFKHEYIFVFKKTSK